MKGLEYGFVWVLVGFLRILPVSVARNLGKLLSLGMWVFLKKTRRVGEENLARSFPDWPSSRVRSTLKVLYRHMGLALAEDCHLPDLDRKWMEKHVAIEHRELIDSALAQGRGVISLVSHFGNWELHGAVMARMGYSVKVVAFPQSNPRVDALIRRNRESTGMKVVYTGHQGTHEILEHLRHGGMVGMLADQNAGKSGLRLPFFGRDCSVAKAPAVLARKTGAALIPMFLLRDAENRFTSVTLPEIPVERTENSEKDVWEATRKWLKVQEEFIREHPEHYFWLHRRWKHFEGSPMGNTSFQGLS